MDRILICTPDKDLAQCVTSDGRVVQFDRRQEILRDEAGVIEKWGVKPASIPDYLALVGDTADGFPGLKGWGAKSAAILLYRYDHLENIPADSADWDVKVRSAAKLGETLVENVEDAFLFRRIATVDTEGPVIGDVDSLPYEGPKPGWEEFCERIDGQSLLRK